MVRLSTTFAALVLACLTAGCMGQLSAGTGLQPPGLPAPSVGIAEGGGEASVEVPAGPVYGPGEDRHWMQADDYFLTEQQYVDEYIYAHLAKMRQPPSAGSKDQALFLDVHDSRDVWTRFYWRTRPVEPRDLALGALAICFNDHIQHDVFLAPRNKHEARTGQWFLGRITDVSDAYKHQVRVAVFDCAVDAVRIVVR
jgi:hypothetical protein